MSQFEMLFKRVEKEDAPLITAFLLSDYEDIEIRKIFEDLDSWMALNEISGPDFVLVNIVPSLKHKRSIRSSRTWTEGSIGLITDIPVDCNPKDYFQDLLNEYFDFSNAINFPGLLFVMNVDNVLRDSFYIPILENTKSEIFKEISNYLSTVSDSLQKILPEYKSNHAGIYDIVKRSIESRNHIVSLKITIKKIIPIGKVIKDISGI